MNPVEGNQATLALPLVEIQGLTKHFPGVIANDKLSLTVRGGEIHTILGENGAGKSTLINLLSGMLQPDQGRILVRGQAVTLNSPRAALDWGIGTVYQHFTLIPNLSIKENILLGLKSRFILPADQIEPPLQAMLADFGLALSPQTETRFLSLGQQQRVEIIKVLWRGSRVLLLDEPTSALTPPEARELFAILLRLKAKGVGIVFITHKLDEALQISDRLTILRQGQVAGEFGPTDLRAALSERIVALMFGGLPPLNGPLETEAAPSPQRDGLPVCILAGVTALDDRGRPALREVQLELRPGEILGLAGVDGNGQKELAEVIAGQRPVVTGQVWLNGANLTNRGVAAAERVGIGYVTNDRLGEGSVPELSVAENAVLKRVNRPPFSRLTILNRRAIGTYAQGLIERFNIKTPGPWARLGTLSGGNIQKLMLARELAWRPKVLVCHQPTQGLDVLTAQSMLRTLRQQADHGMAVLLISAELDELLAVSDRIGVMYQGRLLDIINRNQADRETIGRLMLGWQE